MKHYVITIMDNKKSVKAADRCIKSGSQHGGIVIEKWPAITPRDDLKELLQKDGINPVSMAEVYSRTPNAVAAFMSHFSLWKESVERKTEITIFEHDAVCVNNIPTFIEYNGVISLGKPSYGKFNTPTLLGVNKLTSKPYFPGAHAYRVKPAAAQMLIDQARFEARPTDVFLNLNTFPFLQELYPWPVKADDTFTTIQNPTGCVAKHNKVEIVEA
jgi:GR25 family glycosyltransferase involved in LPS biosynthesis